MNAYEALLAKAYNKGLTVKEKPLKYNNGRIKGDRIAIRKDLNTAEKSCVLAEELGHYYTTTGNILDQSVAANRKQELRARAYGYAIGDYKKRPNIIGMYETVLPSKVPKEMDLLLSWYEDQNVTLEVLAEFHVRYENIHPFQDGNGRTGRLILFRECLRNDISPLIIEDVHRPEYLEALKEYRETKSIMKMVLLFQQEQDYYRNRCQYFMSE